MTNLSKKPSQSINGAVQEMNEFRNQKKRSEPFEIEAAKLSLSLKNE